MDTNGWIAGASLVVAVSAFWLAWQADRRGQTAARSQLFLDLRTRFLEVLEGLPPEYRNPDWEASDPQHRAAAIRYWHHAFDEWYVTKRLNEKLMRQLWDAFYSRAVLAGMRHNGLRKTLIEMLKTQVDLAELWTDFRAELDRLWTEDHPRDGTQCIGIACNHISSQARP